MDKLSEAYLFMKRRSGSEMDRPFWMQLYRKHVQQKAADFPAFADELRLTAIEAIGSDDPSWIRKGIHALAVVGRPDDLSLIRGLEGHANRAITRDAKTCAVELEHRCRASE